MQSFWNSLLMTHCKEASLKVEPFNEGRGEILGECGLPGLCFGKVLESP